MTPAVVLMALLFALAALVAGAVIAAYTGYLRARWPELADWLTVVAEHLNGESDVPEHLAKAGPQR